jgi:hypothetical protein
MSDTPAASQVLLYEAADGRTRLEVQLTGETVWLTQAAMADLYQTTPQNITQHISSIFEEGELDESRTCKPFLQVRAEGARQVQRQLLHYSLPVILAVGYRVRSPRGTQFRQWATARLSELVVKGFTIDDERLKNPGGSDYFDELLARIRDIRSSEKVFYKKILEIYATSVDYDPKNETSQRFFQTMQNKMHWAAHGHTAAEVIAARADASKPNMGLTAWAGSVVRKQDVSVAKNYLTAEEIEVLNRVVTAYLEFAELQAINKRAMTMAAWVQKLEDFLRLSDREILTHAGSITADAAKAQAEAAYATFDDHRHLEPSPVERHFEAQRRSEQDVAEAIAETKALEKVLRSTAKKTKPKKDPSKKPTETP